ncbi:MAG: hypothetical protein HY898_00685 [Deltaproteobacteria bacterium]|nr:hypothetical protein [Deltaproteobacteria bacterium]
MSGPSTQAFADFVAWIEENLGLGGEGAVREHWGQVLTQRLQAHGVDSFDAYRERLTDSAARQSELEALARRLTVGESYFFRDVAQIQALFTTVIPALAPSRGAAPLRVLCVGCSSGEEVYSICMTARESLPVPEAALQVIGFDANRAAVERAHNARYSEWALRSSDARMKARYFDLVRGEYCLAEGVKRMASFHVRNLLDDDAAFWQPGSFDAIFCRNVLIYFSERKIAEAIEKLRSALRPDGFLFLGPSERARGYNDRLVVQELAGTFCYRPIEAPSSARLPEVETCDEPHPGPTPPAPRADGDAWFEAIESASRRLAAMLANVTPNPQSNVQTAAAEPTRRLVAMLREERFDDALAYLEDSDSLQHDVRFLEVRQLARAAIATNQGQFETAFELCFDMLAERPRCAGAHYLLGLASEQRGSVQRAMRHYQAATEADAGLAMAHLKLGQLECRAGMMESARRHLSLAIELLACPEDPVHVLLEGGLSRQAISQLCSAELSACGGQP